MLYARAALQLEMGELPYGLRPEVLKLVRLARGAASLQPDGSKVPCTRCSHIYAELADMAEPLVARKLSTITITYAQRMLRLVAEKVGVSAVLLSAIQSCSWCLVPPLVPPRTVISSNLWYT